MVPLSNTDKVTYFWPEISRTSPRSPLCAGRSDLEGVAGIRDVETYKGRCKATWKRDLKLPWREAGPLNRLDDKVDSEE